jgi:hypothetical protein
LPFEGEIAVTYGPAFLSVVGAAIDDIAGGNGDMLASPGETVALTVSLRNMGGEPAAGISGLLSSNEAGLSIVQGESAYPDAAAGGGGTVSETPYQVQLAPDLEDGRQLRLVLTASHDGSDDISEHWLAVAAPALVPAAVSVDGDGFADPGETVVLTVSLANEGSLGTAGGTATLTLLDPGLGTLGDDEAAYGPIPAGGEAAGEDAFTLTVAADAPIGAALNFRLVLASAEGASLSTSFSLTAGEVTPAIPAGPDGYGYYAYDSADILFAERPSYAWREISTAFGGPGTRLVYNPSQPDYWLDNWLPKLNLPFDFNWYGQSFDQIRLSDNGWVSFDTDSVLDFYNWVLPSTFGNHSMVAPFWDNLTARRNAGLPGDAYVDGIYTYHDAAENLFVVEWSRLRNYQAEITDLQSFQLILLDPAHHPVDAAGNSDLIFQYRHVSNTDYLREYATVGWEDPSETIGMQLSYASVNIPEMAPLTPGLAVRVTTQAPTPEPYRLDGFAAEPDAREGLRLSWSTTDDRPITGWRLVRLDGGAETVLAPRLPAQSRSFLDRQADPTRENLYRLVALHPYGQESPLGPYSSRNPQQSQLRLALRQCQPNPMRETTRIDYEMPRSGRLSLRVYDPAGRLVRTLLDGPAEAGPGSAVWDGRDESGRPAAAGIYLCRLDADGRALTRKVLLVR